MGHSQYDPAMRSRHVWNAGKTTDAKRPLSQKQIWALRFFLDRNGSLRDRALFDLAIDDLQIHWEPLGDPHPARTDEDREHRQLPWRRYRRRSTDREANGNPKIGRLISMQRGRCHAEQLGAQFRSFSAFRTSFH